MEVIILFLFILLITLSINIQKANRKRAKVEADFQLYQSKVSRDLAKCEVDLQLEKEAFHRYRTETEALRKYLPIKEVELAAQRILSEAEEERILASEAARQIMKEAKQSARVLQTKAQENLEVSHRNAIKIEHDALKKAVEIAGEAWKAKGKAAQFEETAKAMKNIIKGYGDAYLIPNETLLDDLAETYNHTQAGRDLASLRSRIKSMVLNNEVAECDYAEPIRRTTAIEFVTDAFNGKVDSIMAKVKHNNYGILLQKLKDAFRIVNHNGQAFKNARIQTPYFDLIKKQLELSVVVHELKKKDQEEQRRIREEIREEERVRREYEKALREAEKEERLLAKALKQAEQKLKKAATEEKAKYEAQLNNLLEELKIAQEKGQRAISMAQQTKQGHVYIISNIGSFGENIFKIGLTRRLNPLDRVKELGDASVPFSFDVHAMIHSDDAPNLEKALHQAFKAEQVNKVNPRKEFFHLPLTSIKNKVAELNLNPHWTMKAEALEYRESLQLAQQQNQVTR
ncbi:MAG: DUF4041 domain-containing protein [Bacteroidota bacterium]